VQNILNISTRIVAILLFILIGWNLVQYALDLRRSGEVSSTLQVPFYPVAFGLAAASLILCLVMFCDIVKILGGQYE
jgi:TRAP-type C4-dicarboxylate transport system permease small subunit